MALKHAFRKRATAGIGRRKYAKIEWLPTRGRRSIDSAAAITAAGRIVERTGKVSLRGAEFRVCGAKIPIGCLLAKSEDLGRWAEIACAVRGLRRLNFDSRCRSALRSGTSGRGDHRLPLHLRFRLHSLACASGDDSPDLRDGQPSAGHDSPGNIGYPGEPKEITHVEKMLRTTARHLSESEIKLLLADAAKK